MPKDKFSYEDWEKVVDKLKKEIDNADAALIDIAIARECQAKLLNYAEMRLGDYPEPVIMAEETKQEQDEKALEEKEEETPEEEAEE